MPAMDPQRLTKLVAQHARTSALLGVDFVPAYRSAGALHAPVEPASHQAEQIEPPAEIEQSPPARREPPVIHVTTNNPAQPRQAAAPVRGDRADSQARLDALRKRYEKDAPHKNFVTAHHNIVFGEGDPCARLCFVGEAPGEEEDLTGRPFVGRAGQLLNKMIAGMGLKREDVYICNVLKTRPPNNATPTIEEANLCEPYLLEQIEIVAPEVVVTLGLPATRLLLKSQESMARLRGLWAELRLPRGHVASVMPTYHPAYLLRNYTPEARGKVWSDLQQVMTRLGLQPAPKGSSQTAAEV